MAIYSTAKPGWDDKAPDDISEMIGGERLSTQAIIGIREWAQQRIRDERAGQNRQSVIDVLLELLSRLRGL